MATIIAKVSILEGRFFAKNTTGNIVELKEGDVITQGMIVFGDENNPASANIKLTMQDGSSDIVLSAYDEQLFDSSLIESSYEEDNLAIDSVQKAFDETLYAKADATDKENEDDTIFDDTEAGNEKVAENHGGEDRFDVRDGLEVDIVSDVREVSLTETLRNKEPEEENVQDITTVAISTKDITEDNDSVTFNIKLSNIPKNNTTTTVQVEVNGVTYDVAVNEKGKGSLTINGLMDEDVYVDPSTITATVTGVTGGNYDSVVIGQSATAHIKDTIDETFLTFSNDLTLNEVDNGTATISASLSEDTKVDLVVTLDAKDAYGNYVTITFPAGTPAGTEMTSGAFAINNDEDVYSDGSSFNINVISTTNDTTTHNNFESLNTTDTAEVTVNDTIDVTYLTLNDVAVDEADDGTATITASLSEDTKVDLVVTLDAKDLSGNYVTITFPAGTPAGTEVTSGEFAINNGNDNIIDASSFVVNVISTTNDPTVHNNFESLDTTDTATVTVNDTFDITNIILVATDSSGIIPLDSDGKVNVTNTNTISEGGKLYYVAVAIDEDGKSLATQEGTVDVTYGTTTITTDTDATPGTDYDNTTTTVNIGDAFSVDAIDDYYAEGDESFTVTISNPQNTPYEDPVIDNNNNKVISTIQDNQANIKQPDTGTGVDDPINGNYDQSDTVYVQITNNSSVIEGKALIHYIKLVDSNGNAATIPDGETITVTLTYNTITGTIDDSDFVTGSNSYNENSTITVILDSTTVDANGVYTITNTTLDNFISEGSESYTLTITDVAQSGAFENVVISGNNSVTGEIKEGVNLTTSTDAQVDETGLSNSAYHATATESLGITGNSDDYTISFDTSTTECPRTSNGESITYSYNGDGTFLTATSDDGRVIFTIELTKDSNGDGTYNFTLLEPMDHDAPSGGALSDKNDFDLFFEFNVTSDGTTSSNQTFDVKVLDSVPVTPSLAVETNEDTPVLIQVSNDAFDDGKITINGTEIAKDGTASVYDPNDSGLIVGTITNNGDGTLTFEPIEDYSNYNATPTFTYTVKDADGDRATATVSIKINPVADAPTINVNDVYTTEDDDNTAEGTNNVALGLILPSLSKDQTDENTIQTGDNPERNGYITLNFTNADAVDGAILVDGSDNYIIDSTDSSYKIVIVNNDGTLNTDYHYSGLDITGDNVISLTVSEYEALQIIHTEDNDTDIDIKIEVESYEVDDNGIPLSNVASNLASESMTVKIDPVTDDISLIWNDSSLGTISNGGKTYTFNDINEGDGDNIDLSALLTKTSGYENPAGSSGDLDGSEKRTYTISGIPEGTKIILGTQIAIADKNGEATIVFNSKNNLAEDPEFSMKLPENYSGTINGTITLSVQDKGKDSSDTAGNIKTQEVDFTMTVAPVADKVIINVVQAMGDEDTAIELNISVRSADKKDITDGTTIDYKETYDVTIGDIPDGSVISYNGSELSIVNGSVTIIDFDNNAPLTITPPKNSDEDFSLSVSAVSKDGSSISDAKEVTLSVIVNDVADGIEEIKLKAIDSDGVVNSDDSENIYQVVTTEDTPASLAGIYESLTLEDNDGSESVSLFITGLAEGFSIEGATYVRGEGDERVWVVSKDDLDNVTVISPDNYSGEVNLNIGYVTTEYKGDSAVESTSSSIKILIKPDANDSTITKTMDINEDELKAIDFDIVESLDSGSESLNSITIDASSIGDDFKLYYKNSDGTFSEITNDTTYQNGDWENIYAQFDPDLGTSSDNTFKFDYTIKDTTDDSTTYTTIKEFADNTYTLNLSAVTDEISIDVNGTSNIVGGNITISVDPIDNTKEVVTINDIGTFTVNLDINALASDGNGDTSKDIDGSETISYLQIEGLPDGIGIVDGFYGAVNGKYVWYVVMNEALDSETISKQLEFTVSDGLVGVAGDEYEITITAYNQDGSKAEIEEASTEIVFVDAIGKESGVITGNVDASLTVNNNNNNNNIKYDVTEDGLFTLNDIVTMTADSSRNDVVYTITFTDLENVTVSGDNLYTYVENGELYYVFNIGAGEDVTTALESIVFTPTLNFNENNSNGEVVKVGNITMTGYVPGNPDIATIQIAGGSYIDADVTPVTDTPTLYAVSSTGIDEDSTGGTFDIKIDTVDTSYTVTNVSITFDSSSTLSGGIIILDNGTSYTVVPGTTTTIPSDQLEGITFVPRENESGEANFTYSVTTQETGASNQESSENGTFTITVNPVVDGFELNELTATGTEHTITKNTIKGDEYIEIKISGNSLSTAELIDNDGSEKVVSVLIDDLPVGFLVYYGDINSPTMATNAGLNEDGNNTWGIPVSSGGTLPNVYIKAPENWSGTLEDINLITTVSDGTEEKRFDNKFTLNITSVASDVTINAANTVGDAYEWNDLNLNAILVDTLGSETATITLTAASGSTALDDTARFKLHGKVLTNVSFDEVTGTWTITGVATTDLDRIEILYHDYKGTIDLGVTITDGNDSSDQPIEDSFELKISESHDIDLSSETADLDIIATTGEYDDIIVSGSGNDYIYADAGDDVIYAGAGDDIIYGGEGSDTIYGESGDDIIIMSDGDDTIDGGDGFDTIVLEDNVTLDFDKLSNIEVIDLSQNSTSDSLTISLDDVLNITDDNNEITINGDSSDTLHIDTSSDTNTWTETGDTSDNVYTYSNDNGDSVTITVDEHIVTI